MTKIGILSLGCPRNLVDSEKILGRLLKKGCRIVDIKDADVAIVNTCAFIEDAKKESIDAILDLVELKKQGAIKKIIVAGCLPERYKNELPPHFKEVDAFIGRQELGREGLDVYRLSPKHYAYVKISEGCRHTCSYCVIPRIKGRLKSRRQEDIIKEIRLLDSQKVSEINIIGQDITSYGLDIYRKPYLHILLKSLLKNIRNIRWLRLLYLHPENINNTLIDLLAQDNRICKYVDLPVQHINPRILKAMNRGVSRDKILNTLKLLRERIPGVAIRTSLIVGFPGETEKEFRELIDFVKEQRFERLGVFRYSREEGTKAYNFKRQVSEKIKQRRFDEIMRLQQDIAAEFNNGFLGTTREVLIDEKEEDGCYQGRLSIDAPEVDGSVFVKSGKRIKEGDFVKVKITDTYEYDLVGTQINASVGAPFMAPERSERV